MPKDSIVIYDVTDQLTDILLFIEPTPIDQFIIDNIPVTSRNPAEITLNARIYINGVLQTAYPISLVTIKWYRYTTDWSEITATDTVVTAIDTNKLFIKIVLLAKIKLEVTYSQNGATHISTDTYDIVDIDTTNQPVVTLSHQAVMFNYNLSGTTTVMLHVYYKGTDITASVFGTGKWEWTPIGQSSWTQKASGVSSIDIGISDAGTAGNVFRYSVTVNGVVYQLMFTVQRLVAPSISLVLTNEVHTLPATSSGTVTSFTGSGTGIYVILNGVKLVPVTVTPVDNQFSVGTVAFTGGGVTTIGLKTTDTTNNIMKFGDYTLVGADVVTATFPVTYKLPNTDAQTINLVQTLTKSKAGVDSKVYYLMQDKYAITRKLDGTYIQTTATVSLLSVTGTSLPVAFNGYFKVWRTDSNGNTEGTAITTTDSTKGIAISLNTVTINFNTMKTNNYTPSRIDVELYLESGFTTLLDKTSVTVVEQGIQGELSTSYWITVSPNIVLIGKDGKMNNQSVSSVTLTATAYSKTGNLDPVQYTSGVIAYSIDGGAESDSATCIIANTSNNSNVRFNVYNAGKTKLLDSEVVPIIRELADLITIVSTNQSILIPCNELGAPLQAEALMRSATLTSITLYEGITPLTPVTSGTALTASKWKITGTKVNGTIDLSVSYTIASNTATTNGVYISDTSPTTLQFKVEYTINYKRANDTDGTATVYQMITKTLQGQTPFYVILSLDNTMITSKNQTCTVTLIVYKNGTVQTATSYKYKWIVNDTVQANKLPTSAYENGYFSGTDLEKYTINETAITNKLIIECEAIPV